MTQTIPYCTQAEAAKRLRWSKQRMWLKLHMNGVRFVTTEGSIQTVLIPTDEVDRLVAEDPEPSRKRKAKAKRAAR